MMSLRPAFMLFGVYGNMLD